MDFQKMVFVLRVYVALRRLAQVKTMREENDGAMGVARAILQTGVVTFRLLRTVDSMTFLRLRVEGGVGMFRQSVEWTSRCVVCSTHEGLFPQ
jgi:hypothetical protein